MTILFYWTSVFRLPSKYLQFLTENENVSMIVLRDLRYFFKKIVQKFSRKLYLYLGCDIKERSFDRQFDVAV